MIDLLRNATAELARFLDAKLPDLAADWWPKHVVNRLSFQQQRIVQERGHTTLQQLDFAALLRVLDQNWYELSNALTLPREGRTWVKELQTVRNKWAHLSAEAMPASEVYRDADTLGRFLAMIGATQASLADVEASKAGAVAAMANIKGRVDSQSHYPNDPAPSKRPEESTLPKVDQPPCSISLFRVGDLVALRSNGGSAHFVSRGGQGQIYQGDAGQRYLARIP